LSRAVKQLAPPPPTPSIAYLAASAVFVTVEWELLWERLESPFQSWTDELDKLLPTRRKHRPYCFFEEPLACTKPFLCCVMCQLLVSLEAVANSAWCSLCRTVVSIVANPIVLWQLACLFGTGLRGSSFWFGTGRRHAAGAATADWMIPNSIHVVFCRKASICWSSIPLMVSSVLILDEALETPYKARV
jgi:hypothetical protein